MIPVYVRLAGEPVRHALGEFAPSAIDDLVEQVGQWGIALHGLDTALDIERCRFVVGETGAGFEMTVSPADEPEPRGSLPARIDALIADLESAGQDATVRLLRTAQQTLSTDTRSAIAAGSSSVARVPSGEAIGMARGEGSTGVAAPELHVVPMRT